MWKGEREKEEGEQITPRMFEKTYGIMLFCLPRIAYNIDGYMHTQSLIFIHFSVYSFYKEGMDLPLQSI